MSRARPKRRRRGASELAATGGRGGIVQATAIARARSRSWKAPWSAPTSPRRTPPTVLAPPGLPKRRSGVMGAERLQKILAPRRRRLATQGEE